ncbi:MAG: NAD(P)/FAD-dependent oxidoreductase [Betaproteobacteria bacterium]
MSRIAVIGAGIAGISCARQLRDAGHAVRVFDKSRGIGGRMATRRGESGTFDHGAQYFTARELRFRALVEALGASGVVAPYRGRIVHWSGGSVTPVSGLEPRYVGVPGMPALCKALAQDLDIAAGVTVTALEREGGSWTVRAGEVEESGFDAVALALPAVQALPLSVVVPGIAARVAQGRHQPCWALLACFDAPLPVDFDAAFIEGADLGWIMRDSSKPGRAPGERWVLHATAAWSQANLELEAAVVLPLLLEALRAVVPAAPPAAQARAHRWRYALSPGLGSGCLFDAGERFGACGDWCADGRVEGAWLSGRELGDRLLGVL